MLPLLPTGKGLNDRHDCDKSRSKRAADGRDRLSRRALGFMGNRRSRRLSQRIRSVRYVRHSLAIRNHKAHVEKEPIRRLAVSISHRLRRSISHSWGSHIYTRKPMNLRETRFTVKLTGTDVRPAVFTEMVTFQAPPRLFPKTPIHRSFVTVRVFRLLTAFRMNHPPTAKSAHAKKPANQLPCSAAIEMKASATIKYAEAKINIPIRWTRGASLAPFQRSSSTERPPRRTSGHRMFFWRTSRDSMCEPDSFLLSAFSVIPSRSVPHNQPTLLIQCIRREI